MCTAAVYRTIRTVQIVKKGPHVRHVGWPRRDQRRDPAAAWSSLQELLLVTCAISHGKLGHNMWRWTAAFSQWAHRNPAFSFIWLDDSFIGLHSCLWLVTDAVGGRCSICCCCRSAVDIFDIYIALLYVMIVFWSNNWNSGYSFEKLDNTRDQWFLSGPFLFCETCFCLFWR